MYGARWSVAAAALAAGLAGGRAMAQPEPVNGVRPAEVRAHAIVGARVVTAPGQVLDAATIVIDDGVITAVGTDVTLPPGTRTWSGEGLTVYPGLIEPALMIEPAEKPSGAGAHWSARVHPELSMALDPGPSQSTREALRKLGFTAAAVYPSAGILRGSGAVIALADRDDDVVLYDDHGAMALGFDSFGPDREYPRSLMGAIAMLRQVLHDAQWHHACRRVWREHPQGNEPPARSDALEALDDVLAGEQIVLMDVSDEHNALRAARIASEFDLQAWLLGSGLEFRRLDEIAAAGLPIIVPLDYPDRPSVSSLLEADDVSLRDMMTWEQAPTNARRLLAAGVPVMLTTHRLDKRGEFPAALRKAIDAGLDETAALAALTIEPARRLGVDDVLGTIETGKAANLVVVEGSLFDKKPKVRDTWVNGRRFEISRDEPIKVKGRVTVAASTGHELNARIDTDKPSVVVEPAEGDKVKATGVVYQRDRLSFVIDGGVFDTEGWVRMTGVVTGGQVVGTGVLPDGTEFTFTATPAAEPEAAADERPADGQADDEQPAGEQPAGEQADDEKADDEKADKPGRRGGGDEAPAEPAPETLVHPLGAYGLVEPPQPRRVYVTNATIWTCGPAGIIEDGAMYIENGRIVAVGPRGTVRVPLLPDVVQIDAAGKHVTPGLIDCHSHTGIDGGVNEMGQTNTAEVRVRDVIDPDDINWYRQLAGGLTACNQLHGSANPIGGQNSVVKLKWGRPAADFPVDGAIEGIKFALGENVKRSPDRYPNTRMGVEAFIRDAFTAAQDYRDEWARYDALDPETRARTMPPRVDLELDALVEILEGRRLVHCHSYRQDEILMLMRLAEDFGFTIGTFQHVLEGYKVADVIAAHGAGASTFSDWWAYKVEVMDAIPFNGALMTDVGVVVSFNSDSSELSRRMYTEAAKAVRYGGLDHEAALLLVTLNPARQLRIDDRVGSLEPGKDGDFVIWSESPLNTFTRCEQTWIEGARYFDLDTDRELRAAATAERERLVQKILAEAHGKAGRGKDAGERHDDDTPEGDQPPDDRPPAQPTADDEPYSCCWSHQR